jgi:hypothetical protein
VLVLHVLQSGTLDSDAVSPGEATARAYLDRVVVELGAFGVRARALVRDGVPAPTILDEARLRPAQLVILGSTIRHGLLRSLLGSVAEAVIRDSPCPILLVRLRTAPQTVQRLLKLDPPDVLVPRDLGRRPVDVARIVGSATRANELGPDFRPQHPTTHDIQRFDAVLGAFSRGEELPPVELYKLGFGYYVRDGHHRVAAARRLGRKEIEAKVIEFVPADDPNYDQVLNARQIFERATGLTRVGGARAESYAQLWACIEAFRRAHGLSDDREAATRWYNEVFRPLRRRVRELGLIRHVPGERPADVIARCATDAEAASTPAAWEGAFRSFGARKAAVADIPLTH